MTLDYEVSALLERRAAAGARPYEQMTVAEARAAYRSTRDTLQLPAPEVASARDERIGEVPIRVYRPLGSAPDDILSALLFLHGGGWVIGDLETHDAICRRLANAGRCVVIAVDYRLAPEHPFPAAYDDAAAVWDAVIADPGRFGTVVGRIAVGGDSAGGALAASLAIRAVVEDRAMPAAQILFYPVTDIGGESAGYERVMANAPITGATMRWFRDKYIADPADALDWRASPSCAKMSLAALPATLIVTAGHDPLCEEGRAFAESLERDGVPVALYHLSGQVHGMLTMTAVLSAGLELIELAGAMLRRV